MDDAEGQENQAAQNEAAENEGVTAQNEPSGPNENVNEPGEINENEPAGAPGEAKEVVPENEPAGEPGEAQEVVPPHDIDEMNQAVPPGGTGMENEEDHEEELEGTDDDETEGTIEEATADETIETYDGGPSEELGISQIHGENEFVDSFPGETFADHTTDSQHLTVPVDMEESLEDGLETEPLTTTDESETRRTVVKKDGKRISESTEGDMELSWAKHSAEDFQELTPAMLREQEHIESERRLRDLRRSVDATDIRDSLWAKVRTDIEYRRDSKMDKVEQDWQRLIYDEVMEVTGESTYSADSLKRRREYERIKIPTGQYVWSRIGKEGDTAPRRRKFRDVEGLGEGVEEEEERGGEEQELLSEKSEECVCEMGKPKFMFKKGHEKLCRVLYPTTDPCVFTESPAFRGRMLYSKPCPKPHPKKTKPLYQPKYEIVPPPHYRHTLLLEELRRIEEERSRIHILTSSQKEVHTRTLRLAVPKLGPRDIRQYRRPFHEWVVLDLDEDGYHDTAAFVRKLLRLGENLTKASKEYKFKWENLMLKDYPKVSKELVKALVEAEKYAKKTPPQVDKSIESLLEVALYMMDISEGFYWVVEQILLRAIDAAVNYKRDCSRREALVRYVYGHLLAEKIGHCTMAMEQLQTARNLSLTKKWKIEVPQIRVSFSNLNLQATHMLCRVIMQYAKEIRPTNSIGALKLLSSALRYLGEPELVEMQASVLLELGVSYEIIGEFRMAHVVMQRYLEIPNRSLEPPGKCSAYLEMAFCHRLLGENDTAEAYLQETLRTAKAAESRELNAVANKYVGIGYLAMGYTKKASKHFQISFKGFMELGLQNEMDYVRVVGAISKGAEIMPYIGELIKQTEDPDDETALDRLIRWRMRHTKFWGEFATSPQLYEPELFNVLRTQRLLQDDDELAEDEELNAAKQLLKAMLTRYKSGKFLLPDSLDEPSMIDRERSKWRARTDKIPVTK